MRVWPLAVAVATTSKLPWVLNLCESVSSVLPLALAMLLPSTVMEMLAACEVTAVKLRVAAELRMVEVALVEKIIWKPSGTTSTKMSPPSLVLPSFEAVPLRKTMASFSMCSEAFLMPK